jgi:hypothetical protein
LVSQICQSENYSESKVNVRKTNILLVDDDPQDRRLVKTILAKSTLPGQFKVDETGTLSEATQYLSSGDYDVVLLDLNLPDSSGIDTIQKNVLSGRTARNFENLIRIRDGSQRILLWNASPLFDAMGQSVGVIAVGQDITDRKRMEEELRRHRNKLEQMVNERTANLVMLIKPAVNELEPLLL